MTDIKIGTLARQSTSASILLTNRLLVLAGKEATSLAPLLPAATSGLVVASSKPHETVRMLRAAYPDLLLAIEPDASAGAFATEDDPFVLPSGGLFPMPLNAVLDQQVHNGASFAITPTGYMPLGAAKPLKQAVIRANELDREDIVLYVPCDPKWLRQPALKQFLAILKRSRHPVALALGHKMDPLAEKGVPEGLRALSSALPWVMLWRTDLAAFDAMAHGAKAGAIGVLASQRHASIPLQKGWSPNPTDRTPRVLVPELLRYIRAGQLQDWFGSSRPWTCRCPFCTERAVDRFTSSPDDHLEAHKHSVACLLALHDEMSASGHEVNLWWTQRLRSAEAAHQRLEADTSVKVPLPAVLKTWLGE